MGQVYINQGNDAWYNKKEYILFDNIFLSKNRKDNYD